VSEEERRRQMDFILDHQAQSAADLQRWREEREEDRKEQRERWKEADARWARTGASVRNLLALAEIREREIMEQSGQIEALREAGRATDERLSALINTAERIISGRRNGGPRQN